VQPEIVAMDLHGGRMACWATAIFRLVNNYLDSLQKFLEEENTGRSMNP
jgi:hypothetical protein